MVRYPITAPQSQERPQRKRVRAAPLQTALAVDALEVAHQVHPEIAPGRHRGRAHPGRVIRPAARLGKGVEAALDQHRLQAVIKHMTRRARHLRPAHHQVPLTILLPSHRHPQIPLQPRSRQPRRERRERGNYEASEGFFLCLEKYPAGAASTSENVNSASGSRSLSELPRPACSRSIAAPAAACAPRTAGPPEQRFHLGELR